MDIIETEKTAINNILPKIEKITALIQQLIKKRDDDFTSEKERNTITKEIFKIQTRLNNYQNKYDMWINEMVEDIRP